VAMAEAGPVHGELIARLTVVLGGRLRGP
jgi:hypothetical protein